MKNRLQIRYHIPESLPTRAQAMAYLKDTFAIGRTNSTNASLPAEPLVILYNDTPLDLANGFTEAKRLETANVILAIGRGGDGINVFNNQDYFVIDFAKHDEEIHDLTKNVNNAVEIITEVNATINQIKSDIEKNNNDVTNVLKLIGEKGDSCEKNTVYGYVQCLQNNIEDEINRAEDAEQDLRHLIELTQNNLNSEIENRKQTAFDLQSHINTEEASRIEGDEINRDAILVNTEKVNELQEQVQQNENEINLLKDKISNVSFNKVKSDRKTIVVTGPSDNGTNIEVNIDNKTIIANESGTLSVSSDALTQYKGENAINISNKVGDVKTISLNINPNDKVLTNNTDGLTTTLSLKWSHADVAGAKDEIQLIGKNGYIISRIDVSEFIKDGMLDSITLNTNDKNNPVLVFTFNTASGKETINVPIKELVDVYAAGEGIELQGNTFSVKIDKNSEGFLTVSKDGIKLSGLQQYVNDTTQLKSKVDELNTKVINNEYSLAIIDNTLKTYVNNFDSLRTEDTKINTLLIAVQASLTNIQTELSRIANEMVEVKGDIAMLKANVVTTIYGTKNEINVIQHGNTATISFADDAYFVAGD